MKPRIALLYPGDAATRARNDPAESRFAPLFRAFAAAGAAVEPAIYDAAWADELGAQLAGVDALLVWHNPIENGRPRTRLDALLRELSRRGVFVSTHPDTIERLGTKDVLLATRDLPFGSDCRRHDGPAQLRAALPARLAEGARVLKPWRGHSGQGVWRVEARGANLRVREARRGTASEDCDWDGLLQRLAPAFADGGHVIEQPWAARLPEGMLRAYLVGSLVVGFGHQPIVALHPDTAQPGPRLYYPAEQPEFQDLRRRLDGGWIAQLCEALGLDADQLPLLWDADFLHADPWMLCEVNVSSVAPFPDAAIAPLVAATLSRIRGQV